MTLDKALSYAGAFVLVLLILLAGIFVIVPRVSETRSDHAETRSVEAANNDTTAQIESRVQDLGDLDNLRDNLVDQQLAVPTTIDASTFISQLAASAVTLGVTVDEISFGDPESPTAPVDAVAAAAAAAAAAGTPEAPDATGTPAPTAATATPESFLVIPVSLSIGGSYTGVLDFIEGLRTGERLVSIVSFATDISGEADAGTVTATISALIYVLPADAAAK
ncbi:hypothetical protein [Cryobacterium sp. PH31-O1]|uniref:hypothetical protein n=1 Tax=Cryobacterium sp. PH31-O1 TaxID=3046306 RepID=UPI0024BB19B0|nr:hypothetical protein [Cryobacterium sp. PH31-O1]MDJ0337780.1 hypothetical protein [Cryobacterium sp. PH31-O1]